MSGSEQELQTLLQKACPMALYIWCHSRRLNLIIEETVEFCGIIKQFFGLLGKIRTFMNEHRCHVTSTEILKGSQRNLKKMSKTCTRFISKVMHTVAQSRLNAL